MKNKTMNGLFKTLTMATLFVSATALGGTKDSGSLEYLPKGSAKCTMPGYEDATFVLFIKGMNSKAPVVELSVPNGETDVVLYTFSCPRLKGAIEFAIGCSVRTHAGMFRIQVASPGNSSLSAHISPIDQTGNLGQQIRLSCKRGFHKPIGKN